MTFLRKSKCVALAGLAIGAISAFIYLSSRLRIRVSVNVVKFRSAFVDKDHLAVGTLTPRGENVTILAKLKGANGTKAMEQLEEIFGTKANSDTMVHPVESVCPNCALNMNCYDEKISFLKPTKCPWHEVEKDGFVKCLSEKPILLIGDSRIWLLQSAINQVQSDIMLYNDNMYIKIPNQVTKTTHNFDEGVESARKDYGLDYSHTLDVETGNLLVTRLRPISTIVNISIPGMDRVMARLKDKPTIVIFNMGAHYMRVGVTFCTEDNKVKFTFFPVDFSYRNKTRSLRNGQRVIHLRHEPSVGLDGKLDK